MAVSEVVHTWGEEEEEREGGFCRAPAGRVCYGLPELQFSLCPGFTDLCKPKQGKKKKRTHWNHGTIGWLGLEGTFKGHPVQPSSCGNTLNTPSKNWFCCTLKDPSQRQGCVLTFLKATWHALCSGLNFRGSSLLNHSQAHVDNRNILVSFGGTVKSFTCWKIEELRHNNENYYRCCANRLLLKTRPCHALYSLAFNFKNISHFLFRIRTENAVMSGTVGWFSTVQSKTISLHNSHGRAYIRYCPVTWKSAGQKDSRFSAATGVTHRAFL